MTIDQLIAVLALGGFGAVISLLVNIGKAIGFIKDGQAPAWVTGINLVVMVMVYIAGILKPDLDIKGLDATLATVAQILGMIFAFIWPLVSARLTHFAVRGVPVIGTSHSG